VPVADAGASGAENPHRAYAAAPVAPHL